MGATSGIAGGQVRAMGQGLLSYYCTGGETKGHAELQLKSVAYATYLIGWLTDRRGPGDDSQQGTEY